MKKIDWQDSADVAKAMEQRMNPPAPKKEKVVPPRSKKTGKFKSAKRER